MRDPMRRPACFSAVLLAALLLAGEARAYPMDGYASTGIRRLERVRLMVEGRLSGTPPPPGARHRTQDIRLRLAGRPDPPPQGLPASDPGLQKGLEALFPDRHESYSIVVYDITPGRGYRLASRQADRGFNPGSVGKLAIAAGLFSELRRLFPDDTDKRRRLLKERTVRASRWIHTDHHTVPFFDPVTQAYASRPIREGDVFSLYEWADHMLSASANAAASTVWKELILMRHFRDRYPPETQEEERFFSASPKGLLRDLGHAVVNEPLRAVGISPVDWQLGSFFTAAGKKIVPSGGSSSATPRGLMAFLVAMESGRIVDEWSSLEIKRLLYMTARRIRYASSPALVDAAVFYKSGSLFRCKPEPGFVCEKYKGNVENVMNSVIVVEHPDGRTYLVTLMSDILRKNSAVEHQTIGTFVDRLLAR